MIHRASGTDSERAIDGALVRSIPSQEGFYGHTIGDADLFWRGRQSMHVVSATTRLCCPGIVVSDAPATWALIVSAWGH